MQIVKAVLQFHSICRGWLEVITAISWEGERTEKDPNSLLQKHHYLIIKSSTIRTVITDISVDSVDF